MLTKISALLLMLWYCFSIIGFDVHTCSASDHQFISTFVEGMSCDDIHPTQKCGHHCSHHHHDILSDSGHSANHCDGYIAENDCCSDHYHVLDITGTRTDEHNHYHYGCNCGHCPFVVVSPETVLPSFACVPYGGKSPFKTKIFALGSLLPLISVWRI